MPRFITLALASLVLAVSASRALAAPPLVVNVILSLTGAGAYLGNTEARTLAALEQLVNERGGIAGRPLKFAVGDDQSNPQVSVQLANALIAGHAPVILGSSISAVCRSVAPLLEKNGPLNYCFSPGMRAAPGSYVFSAGVASADIGVVEARFFRERGFTRVALLSATDSSGEQDHEAFLQTLTLPDNKGLRLVADERFNPTDVSVAAQLARIKAAQPQALIVKATGAAFGTVLRAVHDSGLDVPISASGSNLIASQLAQYVSFAPNELLFAATRGIVPDPSLRNGPLKDAERAYFAALKRAGIPPSNNAVLAWDPASIVISALRRLGPDASAQQLHEYLESLQGWSGVSGVYDFRTGDQRGIGADALLMYRWQPRDNSFTVASKGGGRLR